MSRHYHVQWAGSAIRDLQAIVDYIAQDSLIGARRLADKIEKHAQALKANPARGRIVPELRELDIMTYRELIITPYRLMYRIEGGRVFVLAIFDGRRDLETVLLHRLIAEK
jgi:addiction module RelE/StbE family toxin